MQERTPIVKTRFVTLGGFGRGEVGAGLARVKDIADGRVQQFIEFRLTQVLGQTFGKCWDALQSVRRRIV
jgi:hypothetical protein